MYELLLFIYKAGFGNKSPMLFDMPLKKETELNED